jgi:hypothetical protein
METKSTIIIYDDKKVKKTVKPKCHTSKDMYRFYKTKYPEAKEPYWLYKEVIARFNKKASDAVIFGQVLNFGNRIGNLLIKKIRRNYKKPIVDWGESKKLKNQLLAEGKTLYEEWFEVDGVRVDEQTEGAKLVHNGGEKWLIYFSDPFYLRWAWVKKDICRVKNSSVYKFSPTSDRSKKAGNADLTRLGNKGKLTLYVKNNPSATILYSDWVTPKEY